MGFSQQWDVIICGPVTHSVQSSTAKIGGGMFLQNKDECLPDNSNLEEISLAIILDNVHHLES
jgi:hypothetical protein